MRSNSRGVDLGTVAPLGPAAGARRRRGGWPWHSSRGLGGGPGMFRVIWRTHLRAPRRRGSTRGRCTRRGGLTATLDCSGEQSHEQQGSTQEIRGAGRFLTSRGSDGVTGQRSVAQGHDGRQWRSSGCARITMVSASRLNQGGKGHTKGCPEQLTVRQSSPWHSTRRERDGGRRTGGGRRWGSLHVWAERERGRASLAEGANGRGEVGEQCAGVKRAAGARTWPERAVVGASTAVGRGRVHGGRSWARG
jgi:hypothetical protein